MDRAQTFRRFLLLLALLATLVVWVGLYRELVGMRLGSLAWISAVVGVFAMAAVGFASRLGMWSTGFVYSVLLVAFHLGVPISGALPFEVPEYGRAYSETWMVSNAAGTGTALWLCTAAALAFAVGYCVLTPTDEGPTVRDAPSQGLVTVGRVMVIAGVALFLGHAAIAAPALLLGGDKTLFEATIAGSAPVAYGILLSTVGVVLAACGPASPARKQAFVVFGAYALATLAIGVRTAAMYALVVLVVVWARRRSKVPPQKRAALGVVAGLLVVSVSNQVRVNGLRGATLADFLGSPGAALNEMGWSLRPVIETVGTVQGNEGALRHGSTYFVAFQRYVEQLLGIPLPDPELRWPASVVSEGRSDGLQIGFSAVAEAYLNFGLAAVVFFAVLGWAFGRWDRAGLDVYGLARVAVVVLALFASVRNGSNTVLLTIVLGLVAVQVSRRLSAREAAKDAAKEAGAAAPVLGKGRAARP